jgi:polyphosphate glucokinase
MTLSRQRVSVKKQSTSIRHSASSSAAASVRRILSIDIGATGLKAAIVDRNGTFVSDRRRLKTPPMCPPKTMVKMLVDLVRPFKSYQRVSIGFPGMIRDGVVKTAPNLGTEQWAKFKFAAVMEKHLKRPTHVHNDADVQGLAAISGKGLELVCTLGTGLGTAWFRDGELMPHMDLSHMAIHPEHDFDHHIGDKALKRVGKKEWNKRVKSLIATLESVFLYDRLYLGGGNARCVDFSLPKNVRIVSNELGIAGGAFVWVPKREKKSGKQ